MYREKFVLSIIHDGHPVRETGYNGPNYLYKGYKAVALPFDSEYKVRLKNKNDKGCTARVFIDNKQVSKLGDFIIRPKETIDLERFVDSSLSSGKKFKFVPLDHPDVDDPTSGENGIIKVEFRIAKEEDKIKINYPVTYKYYDDWKYRDGTLWNQWSWTTGDFVSYNSDNITRSAGPDQVTFGNNRSNFVSVDNSNLKDGATVEGGHSNQSFVYSNLDVENFTTILQLKIVGIKDSKQADKFLYKYCSSCGVKIKRNTKYCSECGNKL